MLAENFSNLLRKAPVSDRRRPAPRRRRPRLFASRFTPAIHQESLGDEHAFVQETMPTDMPIERPRSRSARPRLTAISASPLEFSYQNAAPSGRSPKVLARSNTHPAAESLAPRGSIAALSPVMALPK